MPDSQPFDRQEARDTIDLLQGDSGEVAEFCNKLLKEIERLEVENKAMKGSIEDLELICEADEKRYKAEIAAKDALLIACGSYVGIGPNEGDLPIPERVRRCVNRLNETNGRYEQHIQELEVRIVKVKEALAKEVARNNIVRTQLQNFDIGGITWEPCESEIKETNDQLKAEYHWLDKL
jgi:hypothetical protein